MSRPRIVPRGKSTTLKGRDMDRRSAQNRKAAKTAWEKKKRLAAEKEKARVAGNRVRWTRPCDEAAAPAKKPASSTSPAEPPVASKFPALPAAPVEELWEGNVDPVKIAKDRERCDRRGGDRG
jgi:hypothetical protein